MNYRGDFLINHINKIQGKAVLELAAGAGYISENIIEYNPDRFFMSDYKESSTFESNPFKNAKNISTPVIDILHDLPEFYKNNSVDTVICGGYLYHTCHPAWAIEQMLIGRPKWFYLETDCQDSLKFKKFGKEDLGVSGAHNSYLGAISYFFCLPEIIIEEMIFTLNYKIVDKIKRHPSQADDTLKSNYHPEDRVKHDLQQYFDFWVNSTGWWFERND